jgi:hypothetical protein
VLLVIARRGRKRKRETMRFHTRKTLGYYDSIVYSMSGRD